MSRKKNKELDRLENRIRALGRSQSDYKPWLILERQVGPDKYRFHINQAPVLIPLEELSKSFRIAILNER